jgi:hypothetical protein
MPDFSFEFWVATGIAAFTFVLGLGVTLAMDAKTRGEFRFAAGCFLLTAASTVYLIGVFEMSAMWPARLRVPIAWALFATVAVLACEGVRWAHARHLHASSPHKPPDSTQQSKQVVATLEIKPAPTVIAKPTEQPPKEFAPSPPSGEPSASQPKSTEVKKEPPKKIPNRLPPAHLPADPVGGIDRIPKMSIDELQENALHLVSQLRQMQTEYKKKQEKEMDRYRRALASIPNDSPDLPNFGATHSSTVSWIIQQECDEYKRRFFVYAVSYRNGLLRRYSAPPERASQSQYAYESVVNSFDIETVADDLELLARGLPSH